MFALGRTSKDNGAEQGGATGAMAPLVFLVSKSRKVSKTHSFLIPQSLDINPPKIQINLLK